MVRIPFLSLPFDSWQIASQAFASEGKKYRKQQQWKIFYFVLFNPRLATRWFRILKSHDFALLNKFRPRLYVKPFRVYMSIRWTNKQKLKVILDTYRFIMSKGESLRQVITCSSGIEVARFMLSDTIEGTLILGYDEKYRKEGELVLSFKCDQLGGMIAAAAFSFEEIEEGEWVCRIGAIQGSKKIEEGSSKAAQKLLHGLRPKSLIVFAVQEFARQMGCTALYGAGDSIQAYRRKHIVYLPWLHAIQFDYDAIWSESGGLRCRDGWYELPLTLIRRNANEIKTNKRSLYLRRYRMLENLSALIADATEGLLA